MVINLLPGHYLVLPSCSFFRLLLPRELVIIRKGFPIWIAQTEDHGSDDRDGFQISLSLIEPGQSLCEYG
jgi:hypothetical protein